MKMFDSPDVTNPLAVARKRLADAEKSVQTAKAESRTAKRKRKEAKVAARRAKKQLKRAREELDDAQRALAQEEANDALRLKIVRARQRTTSPGTKVAPSRTMAKKRSKPAAQNAERAAETLEPIPIETIPMEPIPGGDFKISQEIPEISPNAGTEPVLEPTEQVPQQNTGVWPS